MACSICKIHPTPVLLHGYGFDSSQERFELTRCPKCGLVQVAPLPSEVEIRRYYSKEYYGTSSAKFSFLLERFVRIGNSLRARSLIRYFPKAVKTVQKCTTERKILDIGCGRGTFLKTMSTYGFECYGTEIEKFEFPEGETIHFLHGAVCELPFHEAEFDAVSIWHVLEHVHDPMATLSTINTLTKPNGILALAVPNFGSLQRRLFSSHWFHLDLPRHLYHFSPDTLLKMLDMAGFEVLKTRTHSLDQNLFGFIQSFLNRFTYKNNPNALYAFLKASQSEMTAREQLVRMFHLVGWGFAGMLVLPFGLLENLFSALTHQGATLIVYARKR